MRSDIVVVMPRSLRDLAAANMSEEGGALALEGQKVTMYPPSTCRRGLDYIRVQQLGIYSAVAIYPAMLVEGVRTPPW